MNETKDIPYCCLWKIFFLIYKSSGLLKLLKNDKKVKQMQFFSHISYVKVNAQNKMFPKK
jgi:hypothetical protein